MTTRRTTCQPHAARGELCVGARNPVVALRPALRRMPQPIGIGIFASCGLAPH